jgi:hypothetical protein
MKRYLIVSSVIFIISSPVLAKSSWLDFGQSLLESTGSAPQNSQTKPQNSSVLNSDILGAGLSNAKISSGLKEALRVGTQRAVAVVGKSGGFLNNKYVHIPLPGPLARIKSGLAMVGASGLADDFEQRINQAAEIAAPKAARIFGDAVGQMSIQDARKILTGPSNSATQYFRRTTSAQLTSAMLPVIDKSLANVGAVQSYNTLSAEVKSLPFAADFDLDLNDYVAQKTLDGIFYYLAKEEADIRANPAARTTKLLRNVFK